MTTLPEEAVKAAYGAYVTFIEEGGAVPVIDAVRAAITAALPFLSALEPSACGYPQWANLADQSKNEDGSYKEPSSGRVAALEEAARALEAWGDIYGDNAAKCVRALASHPVSDKPDEAGAQGEGWLPIESAPKDETLFLAYCPADEDFPDGRMMIWKGSIFAFQKNPTPNHLQFPATHWRPLPSAPSEGAE